MEKINIIVKIKDPQGSEQITDTIAHLDTLSNIISYKDIEGVDTSIKISESEIITIERNALNYYLKLIIDKTNVTNSIYEIYDPKFNIDVEVETIKMINNMNNIYIEYLLIMNKETLGLYTFNLEWNDL